MSGDLAVRVGREAERGLFGERSGAWWVAALVVGLGVLVVVPGRAATPGGVPLLGEAVCGELKGGYGPYDYRTIPPDSRYLVESAHFTPAVEALTRGQSTHVVGADIDYTLRAIPNHPRALIAMMRLAARQKSERPSGARFRLECYFDRALRMAPDDGRVYAVYGAYLVEQRRGDEARRALEAAERLSPSDPQVAYNLALAWFDLKDVDRSVALARRAYAAGIELPGLKAKLKSVGRSID